MKPHSINPDLPQPCFYCGIGTYKKASEFYPGDSTAAMSGKYREEFNYFGITPHADGEAIWLILICNHCGNVQLFRPDKADNQNIWR